MRHTHPSYHPPTVDQLSNPTPKLHSKLPTDQRFPLELAQINRLLSDYSPTIVDPVGRKEAAVSLILREGLTGAELLFIERAHRADDPWSGQMAFPGGRRDLEDLSVYATATRETAEEVSIHLTTLNSIGRLDDMITPKLSHAHGLVISCHVFHVARAIRCVPNDEVQDLVWLQLTDLLRPDRFNKHYQPPNYDGEFPGFHIAESDPRVIWGLTFRIVCNLFRTLGISGF